MRQHPRRRRRVGLASAALVVSAAVTACSGASGGDGAAGPPAPGATSTTSDQSPPSTEEAEAALEQADIQTPPPQPPSQTDNDLVRLAALAQRIAAKQPQQKRPGPVEVAGSTTSWRPGSTYVGTYPDPEIVQVGDEFIAYATSLAGYHVPVLTSRDLRTWTASGADALPEVGGWVQDGGRGGLWAPGVARVGDGWTLAYSAQYGVMEGERHNCIGLARGSSPLGPFRHLGDPLACAPLARQGVIDPDIYLDADGKAWMLWKYSGEVGRRPAGIFSRRLNADGTGWAAGSETFEILTLEGGWEGNTIENPSLITFRGITYLFYSANAYRNEAYATGYAICEGPAGPCGRPTPLPLLDTATTGHLGPGGASAFASNGSLRLLYHAWVPGQVGQVRRPYVAGLYQRQDLTLELVDPG